MVVIVQSSCTRAKWFYSGKTGYDLTKVVVFVKSGCIRTKWLYSGKSVCIRAKMDIYLQSGFKFANGL